MSLEISLLILMGGFAILFLGAPWCSPADPFGCLDPDFALSMVVVAMRIYSGSTTSCFGDPPVSYFPPL
jgi:hypothetical protein